MNSVYSAENHKESGNTFYKQRQYEEAAREYSTAIVGIGRGERLVMGMQLSGCIQKHTTTISAEPGASSLPLRLMSFGFSWQTLEKESLGSDLLHQSSAMRPEGT